MQHGWIWLAVFAALMQAVRTAAQKRLGERMSTLAATYVRSLVGLPFMLAWLAALAWPGGGHAEGAGAAFLGWCLIAAVTQNLGTAALLSLYQRRNFAVANQLARTNLVFTAVLGTLFFSEVISAAGWAAIALTFAGAALLSTRATPAALFAASGWRAAIDGAAVRTGLFIGVMFGLCNLTIREAALSLASGTAIERGGLTVVAVTAMQVVMLGAWLTAREPGFFARIWQHRVMALFVGLTSAAGSIAWFGAFAITNASYVMAVGQLEAVFSVAISVLYFRERMTRLEIAGIAVVVAGIVVFALAG